MKPPQKRTTIDTVADNAFALKERACHGADCTVQLSVPAYLDTILQSLRSDDQCPSAMFSIRMDYTPIHFSVHTNGGYYCIPHTPHAEVSAAGQEVQQQPADLQQQCGWCDTMLPIPLGVYQILQKIFAATQEVKKGQSQYLRISVKTGGRDFFAGVTGFHFYCSEDHFVKFTED